MGSDTVTAAWHGDTQKRRAGVAPEPHQAIGSSSGDLLGPRPVGGLVGDAVRGGFDGQLLLAFQRERLGVTVVSADQQLLAIAGESKAVNACSTRIKASDVITSLIK